MHAPVIIREDVIGYGAQPVLRGLDFTIAPGERIAVLGRSGAGKSTLLNLVYTRCADAAAYVPQAAALVRNLSVFHNVFMGRLDRHPAWFNLKTLAWPGRREKDDVEITLGLVGLADKMFEQAGALSGGQQQRTSMARAIYNGRPIIIGDEPVSALDKTQGDGLLACLAARSQTMVLAMHDVSLALAHATRILVLDNGVIALDAPASALTSASLARYFDPPK